MTVRFQYEWVDVVPSSDKTNQHTMAELSIEAGGATVTSVHDRRNRIHRSHVVVPLLNVAEWLVSNWWHLWYEVADTSEQKPGFEQRHNLAFAGDGFVLPKLTMVPASERVHLHWTRWAPRHARVEFVEEAETYVDRAELEAEFRSIIDAVLERLRSVPDSRAALESLDKAWEAINTLDADEREFGCAAALLGMDPFDVQDSMANEIVAFWERTEPSIREDALASADEGSLSRVSAWLDDALATLAQADNENAWAEIRRVLPPVQAAEPWRQGYELANWLRGHLDIGDGRFDFQSDGPLAVCHHEATAPCSRIQGLVAASAPTCVTTRRNETGTRFLLARALGDYFGRPEPGFGILSSLFTDRQALSRAFAAELLAPAESLRVRLEHKSPEHETIDELGQEFGVSSQLILHQIENHNLPTPIASRSPLR